MEYLTMNQSFITDAVAAGLEKAEIEKPLNMKLTGASWTVIGSIVAICFGFAGLVLWAVDTVRKQKERPTLSDLCQGSDYPLPAWTFLPCEFDWRKWEEKVNNNPNIKPKIRTCPNALQS